MAKLDQFDLEAINQGEAIRGMRQMVGFTKQVHKRPVKVAIANRYNKDRKALYK